MEKFWRDEEGSITQYALTLVLIVVALAELRTKLVLSLTDYFTLFYYSLGLPFFDG